MAQRYVIFVDDDLLAGSVQMAAAAAVGGVPALPSFYDVLAHRRTALGALAAAYVGQPIGLAGAFAAGAAQIMLDGLAAAAPVAAVLPAGVDILEGIGAIVMTDANVDIASLAGLVGIEIVPDREVSLPGPVVSTLAATPPADWHLTQIGAAPGQNYGQGIVIGILDTGIDASHPEFAGKRIDFASFDAAGRITGTVAHDFGDHGTHVSSIAAGRQFGVAPNADLAVAAVLTQRNPDGGMSGQLVQIVNGYNWLIVTQFGAANPGVDIVNASLGGAGFNTYLQRAVQQARGVGIPTIAAIGNKGRSGIGQHGSPGNYRELLGIGASDSSDTVADFSDWGDAPPPNGPAYSVPALSAPGVDVMAAKPGGGTQRKSGTSMATPVVTGVAARRMALNPALRRQPAALFLDLQARLAPVSSYHLGNKGGAGRIIA